MSSKEPKIIFKPYTASFSLLNDGKKNIVKKLNDAISTLKDFKDLVNKGLTFIKPYLNIIKANPLTSIIKSIKKYFQDIIQTLVTSGFYMIIVHPWNQSGNRTKKFKLNLLSPSNEWDQMIQGFQTESYNSKIRNSIEELETLRFRDRANQVSVNYYNTLIDKQKKLIKPENYVEESWGKPIDWTIPVLSYTDAIDEVIKSLDNSDDANRPQWTTANNFVGWGLVIAANDPLELIEKVAVINKIFQFTNLSKSFTKLNQEMRTISANSINKIRASKVANKGWTIEGENFLVEGKNLLEDVKSETDRKEKLKKLKNFLYENTLEKPINKSVLGDDPAWVALSLEQIPYIRQAKNKFFKLFDELIIIAEATDSIVNTIVDTILDKINWLMALIDEVNELIAFFRDLELAIAGVTFTINEDTEYKEGGGVQLLKTSLQKIKNLDTSLFDPSMTQQEISQEIDRLRLCEYSVIIFITKGSTNGKLLKEQWENLTKLLGYELTKGIIPPPKEEKKSLGDIDYTDTNRKALVEVNEELKVENPVLVKNTFTLTMICDPFVQTLNYSLISNTNKSFSTITNSYTDLSENRIITRNLKNLPDKETFTLTIDYTDINNKEYTRIISFSTNFSLFNAINSGLYPEDGVAFQPPFTPIEGDSGIVELPNNTKTDNTANSVVLTNTTNSIQYYSILNPNGEVLFKYIPLIMGTFSSIEFIGLDGAYTIIIYDSGKYELIARQLTKVTKYGIITQKKLNDQIIYISSSSLTLLFPDSLGKYIFIDNKIYELPAFIPLEVGRYSYWLIDSTGKYSEEGLLIIIQSSNLSGNNCLEAITV